MKKVLCIFLLNLLIFLNLNMKIVMAENDKINFSVFLYDDNGEMAIGAIEELQEIGFNTGD